MLVLHNAYLTLNSISYSSGYPRYDGMDLINDPRDCSRGVSVAVSSTCGSVEFV